jgi:predicted MFS family arabinose efflux permease
MARFADSAMIAALRSRNYLIFTVGAAPSLVGGWTQRIALGWLTWELTQSGTWLGLLAFADLFPTVVITPIAGALADRMDRIKMALISQVLQLAQAVALSVLTLTGLITIGWIMGLTLLLGIFSAFNTAARLAMVPNLVERRHLTAAVAVNAAIFNTARFIGPALGGILIVAGGVGSAFVFNALTFVAFIFALCKIRVVTADDAPRSKRSLLSDVWEGLSYAARHPGIGPALITVTAAAFAMKPFADMLPGFAGSVFGGGAGTLAKMTSAVGLGALVSALWLAQRARVAGLTLITIATLGIGGAALIVFALTRWYWLALVCCFIGGAMMTVGGTGTQTLMQNAVDGAMRGRVLSLYGVIFRGVPALGALIMGWVSEYIGLSAAVASGGALCLVAYVWCMRDRRTVARILEVDAVPGREGAGAA